MIYIFLTPVNFRIRSRLRVCGPSSGRGAETTGATTECPTSRRPVGTGHTGCPGKTQLLEVRGSVEEEARVERGLAEGVED